MPLTKAAPKGAALKAVKVKCVYGCTDPLTCPYPHRECEHCKKVRAAGVRDGETVVANSPAALDRILEDTSSWTERHPREAV